MRRQARRNTEGGRIDRDKPLRFRFNGRRYEGYAGDTLASALVANGVRIVGRSFKYHRPRGIVGVGVEEPGAVMRIGKRARIIPNAQATGVELCDGLVARSVNCWPGVGWDVGAVTGLFSRLMPAGFYYKTFKWPAGMWRAYERVIRRAAGLGRAPKKPDPDRYEYRWDHFDVVVVGAGPAGLAAAHAAGRAGARVLLADEGPEPGGALLSETATIGGEPALAAMEKALVALGGMDNVAVLPRATAFGYHDHNFLTLVERVTDHLGPAAPEHLPRERQWKVRAREVVLATGAHERPLVFADNDRPGVMLASAARAYVNRFAARPGDVAVVFTNNDSAYHAAADLADGGVRVAAVIDLRPRPEGPWIEALRARGIEVAAGHGITEVYGKRGVVGVGIAPLDGGAGRSIACDLIACSGGWNPAVHLFSQSGGGLRFDHRLACILPEAARQNTRVAGAANGTFDLAGCLAEGSTAGAAAAKACGFGKAAAEPPREVSPSPDVAPMALWRVPAKRRGARRFVDLHNDVTAADIALAAREGYVSVEHLKRYTTAGMGPDQGKTGNVNALAILAEERGEPIEAVGATTFRPPYTPVSFGAVAGRDTAGFFDPVRKTPIYGWHAEHGAVFEPVGQWLRPEHYRRAGESRAAAVRRECLAARNGVALFDSSTLGKIDLKGPDCVALLDWVYTNAWDRLETGRCRYGLMLHENGSVLDDGVTARLGEQHYLMSTTTGGAATVFNWIEEWLRCEWPHLRVHPTSVTTQWASASVVGPKAREVLAAAETDIDLGAEAFPHMSVREGTVAGIGARVFRVSFTGELSYEVNVPAGYGLALWERLVQAGRALDITPIGLEAVNVLRAEKGFIHVGQETDRDITPHDLGMAWIVSRRKDFLGRRSLARSHFAAPDRRNLVGLLTEDPNEIIPDGAYIVREVTARPPMPLIGHVTSSYFSPALGHSIALALIENGRDRIGGTVELPLEKGLLRARVTKPAFYDPEGKRLNG